MKFISLQQPFNFTEMQALFTLLDFHDTLNGVPSIILKLTREQCKSPLGSMVIS